VGKRKACPKNQITTPASGAQPAGDLRHLGLRELLALRDRLLDAAEHRFFEKLHVFRIDDLLVDLQRNYVTRAVRNDGDFPAGGRDFDSFLLQLSLRLRHLLLHLLSLLHQLVQIHIWSVRHGFDFAFENFERVADQRIILESRCGIRCRCLLRRRTIRRGRRSAESTTGLPSAELMFQSRPLISFSMMRKSRFAAWRAIPIAVFCSGGKASMERPFCPSASLIRSSLGSRPARGSAQRFSSCHIDSVDRGGAVARVVCLAGFARRARLSPVFDCGGFLALRRRCRALVALMRQRGFHPSAAGALSPPAMRGRIPDHLIQRHLPSVWIALMTPPRSATSC
jgi:hypothetical protein